MICPRRAIASFAFIALSCLSYSLHPRAGDAPAAPLDPFSYEDFESSAEAATAAQVLGRLDTGLLPEERDRLTAAIAAESQRAELPIELVLAVIEVESSGNAFAVSPAGAMGMMQLMPATAEAVAQRIGLRWTGPQQLFDPITNVRLGITYLRQLIDRYDSVATALAAYNWGPSRIAERLRQGQPIPVVYAERVLQLYAASNAAAI
jgi:soluble lytic murein transglycosylase-like protein